jgi:hypothetical protein
MKDPFQHVIGQILIPPVETEEAMAEISFRSTSGTARKHDLAEGRFIP